ncbi:MAG TPA: hypothetical protein VNN73_19660 [Blastocatellia bacterium]|jgi:hypothetical protein|nr:hypothetical protein [Blastocatellia bacterium]
MDSAHIHLLLNHIPVVGTGLALLLLAYAMLRKNEEMEKGSLAAFVILALISIAVYLTGEPAEEIVEGLPGVSEAIIESHEKAALFAFIAVEALGVIALAGLILSRRSKHLLKWAATLALAVAVAAGGLMAWAANLGGQVRHTEIRSGAVATEKDKAGEAGGGDKEKNRGKDKDKENDNN